MGGKAKPTKHTSKEIAKKVFEANVNRGGGASGAAARKDGNCGFKCYICLGIQPRGGLQRRGQDLHNQRPIQKAMRSPLSSPTAPPPSPPPPPPSLPKHGQAQNSNPAPFARGHTSHETNLTFPPCQPASIDPDGQRVFLWSMSSLISKGSLAAALALSSLAHDADAFSAASPMARMKASSFSSGVASPAGTMSLAMSARDGSSSINISSNNALGRRSLLRHAGSFAAAVAVQVQGSPAFAKVGDFAKQDFSGSGGDSQSGLGKNDLPAAGKIDPWDNREVANKEYQDRVSSEENINERREKAFAQKDKIFARLEKDIANKEWKSASDYLNVQMLDLRRAMNMVSTKGARAVSAVMKGGEPEKALTKVELAEKAFLASMNKLGLALNGERSPVKWDRVSALLVKGQKDWESWVALEKGSSE